MVRWVVAVLLIALPAPAGELQAARKLLKARNIQIRLRGVEKLIVLDSKESIGVLEQAIERSNAEMERESRHLDKLLARQLKLLPAMRRVRRRLLAGKTSAIDDAKELIRKFEEIEFQIEYTRKRVRLHLQLVRAAGSGFVRFRNEKAILKIEQGALREPDPMVRLFYIAGLRHPTRKGSVPVLLELLDHRDPRVRAAAVRSLIPFARESGVPERVKACGEDPNWAVRLGAYAVMAGAPFGEAVEFLVQAAVRERGEMALAADSYLYYLTGSSFWQRPGHWQEWWTKNGSAVQAGTWTATVPETAPGEGHTVASFFRIPLQSERILFALDFSNSMAAPLVLEDLRIKGLMEEHDLRHTRLGYAKAEFVRAINALPDGAYFNVLGYNDDARRFHHGMVQLTTASRKRAIRWVLRLQTNELTNIGEALHESFGGYLDAGGGARRFEDLPDTVVLLTDGLATRGRFTETSDLRSLVQIWNQPLDIVFHCVGIGKGHDRELLAGLAQDTGGYYVDVGKGLESLEPRRRPPPEGLEVPVERIPQAEKTLGELLEMLESAEDEDRLHAAQRLAALGPAAASAAQLLTLALQDISANVQEAASDALAAIGPKAVPHLIYALGIEDVDCVTGAANALAKIGPTARAALPHLEKLRDHDDSRAKEAVRAAIVAIRG